MKMKVILIGCLFILIVGVANATIINVPADQTTIQLGLNSASSGDTVLVSTGIYYENIIWPEVNGIVLISESGAELTIIDGNNLSNTIILEFYSQIDTTTIIDGFTICNGNAHYSGGGGIHAYITSPTIQYCIIENNVSLSFGGGIFQVEDNAIIRNNIIRNNSAESGGGISLGGSETDVYGNKIYNNSASWFGGGIFCGKTYNHFIRNNEIYNNSSDYGGGIHCYEIGFSIPVIIEGNDIHHNTANQEGGGISFIDASVLEIFHNQIHHNESFGGGGVFAYYSVETNLHQNDIFQNSATNHGAGIYCVSAYDTLNADNNWWGDASGPYNEILNPNGTGNEVYGTVDFIPWATEPFFPSPSIENNNLIFPNVSKIIQNYPNPFNSTSTISFTIKRGFASHENTEIEIYNIKGQKVKTIVNEKLEAGLHKVIWDGKDESGKPLSSGIYFYLLKIDDKIGDTKKCILLR